MNEIETSGGTVESVTEQEIASAKAIIGRCGIGCEPASAATLAGLRKLVSAGLVKPQDDVVAILTGHVLKDPDFIYKYHTCQLKTPSGKLIESTYGNAPRTVPNDAEKIAAILENEMGA
jgi:threonine synthase